MKASSCRAFRRSLERALSGRPGPVGELAWHEHVLTCVGCRELLAAEQALELLLSSLPEPELPRDLAERVLARLGGTRRRRLEPAADLDALLDLDRGPRAPADLGRRVLDGLAAARAEAGLDRLLDSVPAPEVPAHLAARVLAGLDPLREELGEHPRLARGIWGSAAAILVIALVLWAWLAPGGALPREGAELAGLLTEEVEPELLASLDLLENWELLMGSDLDALLASLDPVDEALIEVDEFTGEEGEGG